MNLSQEAMGIRLGLSLNYVNALEKGKKQPSDAVKNHVELMQRALDCGLIEGPRKIPVIDAASFGGFRDGPLKGDGTLEDPPSPRLVTPYSPYEAEQRAKRHLRTIKLIGWAHAGKVQSYEELPPDWQELIPTDCPDPDAFAVTLEGPSQEPLFHDGDRLTLMPHADVWSGCQCVVKFKDDGALCRRVELREHTIRLHAANRDWEPEDFPKDSILWMYRIWGAWTQVYR